VIKNISLFNYGGEICLIIKLFVVLAFMVSKTILINTVKISVRNIFQKVFWVFENGQKKMSKIENPKKVLKKTLVLRVSEHYRLNHRKNNSKNVTIIFFIFYKKNLDTIFC
jgi:hypothetical protein